MKDKIFKIIVLAVLLLLIFSNYKFFRSSILQAVLISDYNTSRYSIQVNDFDKFDINYPNITQTTIPIQLLKGRYYNKIDSTEKAIELFKKSLTINPYLKMPESELSQAYFKIKKYDSAYYYAQKAFTSIPNNNNHRFALFQTLVHREDSVELKNAFETIKRANNKGHWAHYLLSRRNISKKYTPYIDSLFNIYVDKFNKESDVSNSVLKSRLVNGNKAVITAAQLSVEGEELYNQQEYIQAAQTYELAILINSYDYTFYQNAAIAYANTQESGKALEYFDKVINDFKIKDGKSHFYKGILLLKLNRKSEGCAYLKQASEYRFSGQGSSQLYNNFCVN